MFQLPEGVIPLDVLHRIDHKTPKTLNIPIMNVNNTTCSLAKNSPITTLIRVGRSPGSELDQATGQHSQVTP